MWECWDITLQPTLKNYSERAAQVVFLSQENIQRKMIVLHVSLAEQHFYLPLNVSTALLRYLNSEII